MRFMVLSYRVFQPRLIHYLNASWHISRSVILARMKLQFFWNAIQAHEPWTCFSGTLEASQSAGTPITRQRLLWRRYLITWRIFTFSLSHKSLFFLKKGYWSSGTRLSDSARITGDGIQEGELPEYMALLFILCTYLVVYWHERTVRWGTITYTPNGYSSPTYNSRETKRNRPFSPYRKANGDKTKGGGKGDIKVCIHWTGFNVRRWWRWEGVWKTSCKVRQGGTRETSDLHGAISNIKSQIVNELVKKEFLRLNVDYALFKEHKVQIWYPISGCHSHTFWVEPVPSDSLISREALTEDEESDPEFELVGETDTERREALLKSDKDADLSNKLGPSNSWKALEQDFDFNNRDQTTSLNVPIDDIIDLSSDDDNDDHCNIGVASGSTFIHGHSSAAKGKGKFDPSDNVKENTSSKARHPKSSAIGLGGMVKAEIDLRKKEYLGMAPVKGSGRTLGSRSTGMLQNVQSTPTKWNCLVCTLSVTFSCSSRLCADTCAPSENQSGHLSCSACSTPCGDQTWSQKA